MKINSYYDVVIIGASISGLECAKQLVNTGLGILLLDQKLEPGDKVCAGGITLSDKVYLPDKYFNFDWQPICIHYKNKKKLFSKNSQVINSFNRFDYITNTIKELKGGGINFVLGQRVRYVVSNNDLELSNGQLIKFKYLVGADGAVSVVRKFLRLPIKKYELAMQYILPYRLDGFNIYLKDNGFSSGFIWSFPHPNFTSIGCGVNFRDLSFKQQRDNFKSWLKEENIDLSGAKFETALINYDYRGYQFDNIYLAGEAGGFTSGFTGKGIYPALISGKQIGQEILLAENKIDFLSDDLISHWLRNKHWQEKYLLFLRKSFLKKFLFYFGLHLCNVGFIRKKIIKHLA